MTALGLAFFKLSLGIGTMITYASYFTKDNNLLGTATKVALSDTLVSLLAGLLFSQQCFLLVGARGRSWVVVYDDSVSVFTDAIRESFADSIFLLDFYRSYDSNAFAC